MNQNIHSAAADVQSLERIYDLLRDQRCRDAVAVIAERDSSIPLDELATAVLEMESGSEPVSATQSRDVVATLHHVHLPKLDDADVIDYDTATNAITPARTEMVTPFLEPFDEVG